MDEHERHLIEQEMKAFDDKLAAQIKEQDFQLRVELCLTFPLMCLFGYITYFYWFTHARVPLVSFVAGMLTLYCGYRFFWSAITWVMIFLIRRITGKFTFPKL